MPFVLYSDGDLLQFNATADILVSSDKPLAPFVSMEKVMNEKSSTLPSIYPVNYTIDLIPTHIYDIKDFHRKNNFKAFYLYAFTGGLRFLIMLQQSSNSQAFHLFILFLL